MLTSLLFSAGLLSFLSADPPVAQLELPAGFKVELYAQVENTRQMALGSNGTVFVGSRKAGKVRALVDEDGDYRVDRTFLIASGLNMPSGIAFRNGDLYVAAVNRVLRYNNIESRLADLPEPVVITNTLPDGSILVSDDYADAVYRISYR
jgi:glucose/arabinose dehydrogenase